MAAIPRLFVPPEQLRPGRLLLAAADRHRLTQVLRLREGAPIELFDGAGQAAAACLIEAGLALQVEAPQARTERLRPLCVAVGMPSPERSDWLVEKLVELGVAQIQPLHCARSQGGPAQQVLARRCERWERLARAAARQAERPIVPAIAAPLPLAALAPLAADCLGLVATLPAGQPPPPAARLAEAASLQLVVGPPGGLTDAELGDLRQRGYTAWHLGPTVLRTETAALCGSSILLHGGLAPPAGA